MLLAIGLTSTVAVKGLEADAMLNKYENEQYRYSMMTAIQFTYPVVLAIEALMTFVLCGGTLVHLFALVTMASASMAPNPCLCDTLSPAPFTLQSPLTRSLGFDV